MSTKEPVPSLLVPKLVTYIRPSAATFSPEDDKKSYFDFPKENWAVAETSWSPNDLSYESVFRVFQLKSLDVLWYA